VAGIGREEFARRPSADLGKPVRATEDWRSCVEGADIVVEASRLSQPDPLLKTEWISPGAFVVPYGTMSAVGLSLSDIALAHALLEQAEREGVGTSLRFA
jgi:alanine dehydrogenase